MFQSNLHCQVSTDAESHTPVRALYHITDKQSDRSRIHLKKLFNTTFLIIVQMRA